MSSVFKGIKKIFKKVVKVVKKIAPVVLGVAALVFTGGAALGLAPLAGGWSAAAATVGSTLGGTGVLGSALTGAITQAGTGALIGGGISALSGGSVREGLKRGAAAGAITGGLLGAASGIRARVPDPLRPIDAPASGATIDNATGEVIGGGAKTYPYSEAPLEGPAQAVNAAGEVIAPAGGATGGRGLLSRVGGFIKDNPEVSGGIIKGLGTGLFAESDSDVLRTRHGLVSANYAGADPGANYRGAAPGTSGQTPTERFDPKVYGSFEYQYDPKVGRIVRVPVGG